MASRALSIPVMIVAAAAVVCLVVLLANSQKAEATFPGKNGKIAFYKTGGGPDIGGPDELFVVNADGSGLRNITNTPDVNENTPAWSLDGKRLVYQRRSPRRGADSEIAIIHVKSGSKWRITDNSYGDLHPAWSPDGTEIAFRRDVSGKASDIYVVRPDGTGLRNITNTPNVYEGDPTWSPNGRRIAFLLNDQQTSHNDIWTVRAADGSDPVWVTDTPSLSEYAPTWQPIP